MANVSKERKEPPKPVRTLKMWNKFVCRFTPVYDNDPKILLTALQERDLENIWLHQFLVYCDHSKTSEHLQNSIQAEIDNIPIDMLEKVIQSFPNRLHQYSDNGDRHLTDIV
ncbi:uncharacterized protein TNCV_4334281 [Trichonephila clavipes]|nr:uncharacterized protein TNCV_4334281 [Trichonephila clavipes]